MSELDAIRARTQSCYGEFVRILEKTPADKADYKPAPTCNSTIDILKHVAGSAEWFAHFLDTGEMPFPPPDIEFPSGLPAAKDRLAQAHARLLAALDAMTTERLQESHKMPWGETATVREMWHFMMGHYMWHAGQVAYIQTILGIMDW